ncbi:MAG: ribonuclease P protein component [Candidatus Omnitrophica bacterium]|nr:ribonuclease P protein component [Candidatus Omnitrophota bacterium]MBU4479684.1 ribonuclease P protein component [Candidatus Omnitrophota bacterium]MCG2703108.1 ribonuclease P protein component [Candidatus Omnitrophota bacterium]
MKQCGLSKKERLLRPFQYKNVYRYCLRKKGRQVWVYTMPNGLMHNRIGISVSKKTCTNNVNRNRVKRIIRQVFQRNKDIFGEGKDIVFVLKEMPETASYDFFKEAILKLF